MNEVAVHPEFLADEDCEQLWVRYDVAADEVAALKYVADTLGLDAGEMDAYECTGTVRMRQATPQDVEEGRCYEHQQREGWYFTCRDDEPGDETYWKVTL